MSRRELSCEAFRNFSRVDCSDPLRLLRLKFSLGILPQQALGSIVPFDQEFLGVHAKKFLPEHARSFLPAHREERTSPLTSKEFHRYHYHYRKYAVAHSYRSEIERFLHTYAATSEFDNDWMR